MRNHYRTLGVPRSATQIQIKEAFKRLALKYHPDRNPDDPHAEEKFKNISQAYDTLSNPEKKARYDLILSYSETTTQYQTYTTWKPPGPTIRKRPARRAVYKYETGWTYVKHQLLAFGFVFAVAVLVLSFQAFYDYQKKIAEEHLAELRQARLATALMIFEKGEYRISMDSLTSLISDFPGIAEIREHKRQLLKKIRFQAEKNFKVGNYQTALFNFNITLDYEEPYLLNDDIYFRIASCYEHLGQYEQAVSVLNQKWINDHENITLNVELGRIYSDMLDDQQKALTYFNKARERVRYRLSSAYGKAYEIVVNPTRLPDIYFEVYHGRALANFRAGQNEESIVDCNWAIFFRKENADSYHLRALNYQIQGNRTRACRDLNEAIGLGFQDADAELLRACR